MNEGITPEKVTQLAAPFPPENIHWRAQMVTERNGKFSALALAYIDARDVMDRLDTICGPENWTDRYEETPKGRIIGTIGINIDGYWVTKTDGAGETDVEGEKGAVSDALKRAAVKWGIGRYLYGLGSTWADCEVMTDREGKPKLNQQGRPTFKKWTSAGLTELKRALGGTPKPKADPTPPKPMTGRAKLPAEVQDCLDDVACRDTQDSLRSLWEATGSDLAKGAHGAVVKDAFNRRKAAIELLDSVN